MYKLTEKLMRDKEKDEIYLTFFPGAMVFWRKMGFYL